MIEYMIGGASAKSTRRARKANPPQLRLIRAAERLFSERGIDSVSMREIAIAAECGDNNAVQYNFGSKDGLLAAIFATRVAEMEPVRDHMLQEADEARLGRDPFALLAIICLPYLTLADEYGRHPYSGFMVQFATRYWSPVSPIIASTNSMAALADVMKRVKLLLPQVHPELASSRIMLCNLMFQNMLVRWDHTAPENRTISLTDRTHDVLSSASKMLTSEGGTSEKHHLCNNWLWAAVASHSRISAESFESLHQ